MSTSTKPTTVASSNSQQTPLLTRQLFKKYCEEFNFFDFEYDVPIQMNAFVERVCLCIFFRKSKKKYTVNKVDQMLNILNSKSKLMKVLKSNGEKIIIDNIRKIEREHTIYKKTFKQTLEAKYGVVLEDYHVAEYIAGILDTLCFEILETIRNKFPNTTVLFMSHIFETLDKDKDFTSFLYHVNFEFEVKEDPSNTKKTVAKPNTKRPPKLIEVPIDTIDLDEDYDRNERRDKLMKREYHRLKDSLLPCDMLFPDDGYRANDTYIIGRDGTLERVSQDDSGQGYIQPWVSEILMKKGYTIKEIMNWYSQTPCKFFLYPRSMQGKHLKVDKKGFVTKILGYDYFEGEDADEDDLDWDHIDRSKESDLFL